MSYEKSNLSWLGNLLTLTICQKIVESLATTTLAQFVRAIRACTTFPQCSLNVLSAKLREISISFTCTKIQLIRTKINDKKP